MNTNFFLKFINKKKYNELKYKKKIEENLIFYNKKIKSKISDINNKIEKSDNLNFLHSGQLGDLIYSLSLIKELSKEKKCNLLVEIKDDQGVFNHF